MFYLRDASADKTTIYLIATYKKIRFKYPTGESIAPGEWRKEKDRSTNKFVNAVLDRYESLYNRLIDNAKLNGEKVTEQYLFNAFEQEFKLRPRTAGTTDFYKLIDLFIKDSESGDRKTRQATNIVPGRIKHYYSFKNKLLGYKKEVDVNDIDLNFYKGYIAHRSNLDNGKDKPKGKSLNSIGSEISIMKAVLTYTYKAGLHKNKIWEHDDFRTFDEDVENVFLDDSELDILWSLKTLTPKKQRVLDLFIIGCYTGLRIADLLLLDESNIEGNLFKVITGNGF